MVLAGVVATSGVRIGEHVAVMPLAVLTHEVIVGNFATIASSVALAGGVAVGRGGLRRSGHPGPSGASVGAWAMTGMGSLVLEDVPRGGSGSVPPPGTAAPPLRRATNLRPGGSGSDR